MAVGMRVGVSVGVCSLDSNVLHEMADARRVGALFGDSWFACVVFLVDMYSAAFWS
jgi:hypothetical protein